MRDVHEGDADLLLDALELELQLAAQAQVQRAERLVEQQRLGRLTSARASATRCCWPPDICAGLRFSRPAELRELEHLGDARLDLGLGDLRRSRPNATLRSTSRCGNSA